MKIRTSFFAAPAADGTWFKQLLAYRKGGYIIVQVGAGDTARVYDFPDTHRSLAHYVTRAIKCEGLKLGAVKYSYSVNW